jgi:DnaJ family protein C protein 7
MIHTQVGGPEAGAAAAQQQQQQRDAKSAAASWRARATESYKSGKYKLAEEEYSRAIEALTQGQGATDELAQLYSNRGGARLMMQRPNAALKDALMSIQTSRKYVRGYLRAAACYTKLGDLAAAHQVLSRISDMTSASNPVWRELSQKVAQVEGRQRELRALRKGVIGVEEVAQLEASGGMGPGGTGPLGEKEAKELLELACVLGEAMPYAEEVAALQGWLALRAGDLAAASQAATWSGTVVWDWHETDHQQQHGQDTESAMGGQHRALGMGWEWWIKAQVAYHQGNLEDAQRLLKEAVLGAKVHVPDSPAAAVPAGSPGKSMSGSSAATGRWARPLGALVPTQAAAEQLLEELLMLTGKKEAGNAALRNSKAEEAVKAYSEALTAQGSSGFAAVLYCNRAAAHHSLKQYVEALADCGRALALKPDYVKAQSR